MKPWIKRTLFGLFGASLVVGGLTACASRHHGYDAGMSAEQSAQMREKMIDRMAGKLDLNADQKKRLSLLGDKLHAQRLALLGQGNDPRDEIKGTRATGGVGLGLYLCRLVAQAHGGSLAVSNAHPGLEVRVLLPA